MSSGEMNIIMLWILGGMEAHGKILILEEMGMLTPKSCTPFLDLLLEEWIYSGKEGMIAYTLPGGMEARGKILKSEEMDL